MSATVDSYLNFALRTGVQAQRFLRELYALSCRVTVAVFIETIERALRYRITDIETLRLHYAYTLSAWLERTQRHKTEIVALYDERFFRMWEFYLAGGIVGFELGTMCNYQLQYVRNRNALPITRDYMLETEQRYRALSQTRAASPRERRKVRDLV